MHILEYRIIRKPCKCRAFHFYGTAVWDPIENYIRKLGGEIIPYTKALNWQYRGHHISGIEVAQPDPVGHGHGSHGWQRKPMAVMIKHAA